jgi:hypothetical protein
MNKRINILAEKPSTIVGIFERAFAQQQQSQVDRALEIVQEEYDKLIKGMIRKSRSSGGAGVAGAKVSIAKENYTKGRFFRSTFTRYNVSVDDDNDGGVVFNILDLGEKRPKGDAAKHGLKAWPMRNTRSNKMTAPGSLKLAVPNPKHEIIFRPVIRKRIAARNFTESILLMAKRRASKEGLDVEFTLED